MWAAASLAGLTALLAASTVAYDIVRVAGAVYLVLVAIHLAVTFVWFPPVIWAAARARRLLLRDKVRRWLDRATATVLIALGVKLVTDTR
jgi:threonine/homoserine/homoserine lactone efflux protein